MPKCLKCRRSSDKAQLMEYVHVSKYARASFHLCHRCGMTSAEVEVERYAIGSHTLKAGEVVGSEVEA